MRILLIGGAGAVGSALAARLRAHHDVTVGDLASGGASTERLHLDATDPAAVRAALARADAAVHLAAVVPRGSAARDARMIDAALRVNVSSVVHTLHAARETGVGHVVHASTLSVFRDYGRVRIERGAVPDAHEPYGLTKRLAETACRAIAGDDLRVTSLRLAFPTTDALWPAWRSPGAGEATAPRVPALDDGTCFGALHPDDLADAVEAALHRDGAPYAAVAVTGDTQGVSIDDDTATNVLGWKAVHREPWLVTAPGHAVRTDRRS